jgi:hypothetical protein
MTQSILSLSGALLFMALSAPASASDKKVQLPAGSLNGSAATCSVNATSATLKSSQGKLNEYEMALGDRLAFPAKRGDGWRITCKADGLSMMSGTGCFFDGYIVAGFERGGVAISCYEGKIPKRLK